MKLTLFGLACFALLLSFAAAGSAPQKAFVWPAPQSLSAGSEATGTIAPRGFTFLTDSNTKQTDLLRNAFDRYYRYTFDNRAVRHMCINKWMILHPNLYIYGW
jgi:hypothetical protein